MTNSYNLDTLTSVDIFEIDKMDGKVIGIYEVVIYGKNIKISPLKKIKKIVCLKTNFKDKKMI